MQQCALYQMVIEHSISP